MGAVQNGYLMYGHNVIRMERWTRRYQLEAIVENGLKSFNNTNQVNLADVGYITANLHTEAGPFTELGEFRALGDTHFHDELGTVPAHLVTNNTIEVGRNSSCPRVIAHYLQPHVPFLFHSDEGRDNINLHSMSKQNKDFWKHDGVF